MRVRIAVLAAFAGLIAPLAAANAARLEKEACDGLKAEQATLVAAGVRDKMQGGPEHAKAAFGPAVLEQIKRLIEVEEQITFRCDRPRIAALRPPAPTPPPGAEPAPAAGEEPAAESPAHPKPKKQKKAKAPAAAPAVEGETAAAPPAPPKKKKPKPNPDAAAEAPAPAKPKAAAAPAAKPE